MERADYAHPQPDSWTLLAAGRLTHFQQNWTKITNDPWIAQTISGYHIPFISHPFQVRPRITKARSRNQQRLLQNAIEELMDKQVIQEVTDNLNPVYCSAKEQNTPGLQLEATECIRGVNQIQDGRPAITTLYATRKRLHDEIRSQGCLLFNSNNETTQEVSAFHFRQCDV